MATEDETRAAAVREAAAYLERITRRGLVPLSTVLADLEAVAERMSQGMTARGSLRSPVSANREDSEPAPRPDCGARDPQIAGGNPCIRNPHPVSEPHVSAYGGRSYEWMPGGR